MKIFDYENIMLIPRKCFVNSRTACDTTVALGKRSFQLPVVPANMKTVINEKIAAFLAASGFFYIMHRFDIDAIDFTKKMHEKGLFSSISLGIKPQDYATVDALKTQNLIPDYITIDIAHGHSNQVRDMIFYIKKHLPTTFLIAGNVGTPDAVIDLESWGADATKLGIGPGKVCITRLKTGFGTGGWQLSALKWCSKVATKPIIADGGIREHGDIAKSIRFGATFCMVGSLFAGLEDAPGDIIEIDGKKYKEYYGSASEFNKNEYKNVEGKRILEPVSGTYAARLKEMQEDLQSSISYAGGTKLLDIRRTNYIILGHENPVAW